MTYTDPTTCPDCPWERFTGDQQADQRDLAKHRVQRHGAAADPGMATKRPLPQLVGVVWWEQAVAAVKAAADTGREFRIWEALRDAGVGDPPDHKTRMGRFTQDVARLLDLEFVRFDRSTRPDTNRSSAGVWRGKGKAQQRRTSA